jgi:hypothetical protein
MKNADISVLHDVAMEFVDEARFAANRGDEQTAKLFFQKAFNLEKMVALSIPDEAGYQLSRTVFLRSAATLALDCGYYGEAEKLAEKALAGKPHSALVEELNTILEKARQENPAPHESLSIIGTIVAADIPGGLIKIQVKDGRKLFTVHAPPKEIGEVVKRFWDNLIRVKATHDKDGVMLLKDIQKAA